MSVKVSPAELSARLKRFFAIMDMNHDAWRYVFLFDPVAAYYFTGTMQDGVLFIQKGELPQYFVRKCVDRAVNEIRLGTVAPMASYGDIKQKLQINPYSFILIDKMSVPMGVFERFNKYFNFNTVQGCDTELAKCRAIKSAFEIGLMMRAGEMGREVLEDVLPNEIHLGMTEGELGAILTKELLMRGHHGISRIRSYGREMFIGAVAFGDNALKPVAFDTPDGLEGISPAAVFLGSHERQLRKNELILVDIASGFEGYHADITQIYYTGDVPEQVRIQHNRCVKIRDHTAMRLVPGAIPSDIYKDVMKRLHPELHGRFMGLEPYSAQFLGHGVGLYLDDYPAVARGFTEPLVENMVIALEPKAAIERFGMVGVENTYIVTANGGVSVNGSGKDIISVAQGENEE